MELKKGYQQTEVGLIPDDWRLESIGEISTVGRGRVISHKEIARSKIPLYPVYSSQTTNKGAMGYVEFFEFEGNYITWTTDGANAGTVFAREGRFNCTNVCGTIKPIKDNHQFIANVLAGIAPGHVSRHLGNPKLMNDVMKRVKIPFPPTLAEQEAIAGALSDADAWIESLEQLIAKKRQIKHGAMQELLTGQTRLPGFSVSKPSFQNTQVGPVPVDWDLSTVGDEYDIQLGKMLDAEKNAGVPKPYLGNRAVQWGRIDVTSLSVMAMSDSDLIKFRLKERDLLVCEGGEVGRAAIWDSPIEECYYQKAIHRLRAKTGFSSRLMIAFLQKWAADGHLTNYVTQTSIAHLPKDKFVMIPLPRPTIAEQIAIAQVLADLDAGVEACGANLAKARQIKQGMMQELLTGRIRLV